MKHNINKLMISGVNNLLENDFFFLKFLKFLVQLSLELCERKLLSLPKIVSMYFIIIFIQRNPKPPNNSYENPDKLSTKQPTI